MDIHQGLNGGRQIMVQRPDHSITYFQRGRAGFVQQPFSFHGNDFARRTYVYHGQSHVNFFLGFGFRGLHLSVYAPSVYYGRSYYGWAYNPWRSPIRYRWGWMGSPWNSYYGYYFQPSPMYSSASVWLADYLISTNLQAAYAAHQEGGEMDGDPSGNGAAPLTPEVKQMVADEVRNQLALENQESQQNAQGQPVDPGSSGIARILNDVAAGHPHVFVAGSALDVVDNSGAACSLSDGDALQLSQAPAPDATSAQLLVLASKGGQECPRSDTVVISLDTLQEMQNQMRSVIDQGLQTLQANQGQGGLPAAPAASEQTQAVYASSAPPEDPNAATQIQQTGQQADQAQTDVTTAVTQNGGTATSYPADANGQVQNDPNQQQQNNAAPADAPTVTLGQSTSDVEAILGQPANKAKLGKKIIYNYSGMKVIFTDGRVSDVQ